MAKIYDLDLYRPPQDLNGKLPEDPCSSCSQVSHCVNTCERAKIWWDRFAKNFRKAQVISFYRR
jgi:hypothetical protein